MHYLNKITWHDRHQKKYEKMNEKYCAPTVELLVRRSAHSNTKLVVIKNSNKKKTAVRSFVWTRPARATRRIVDLVPLMVSPASSMSTAEAAKFFPGFRASTADALPQHVSFAAGLRKYRMRRSPKASRGKFLLRHHCALPMTKGRTCECASACLFL